MVENSFYPPEDAAPKEITVEPPRLPDDIIPSLRDTAEYATDPEISDAMVTLVSVIQIHNARMTGLPKTKETLHPNGRKEVTSKDGIRLIRHNSATLFKYASDFLDYARDRDSKPPSLPDESDVMNPLFGS